MTDLYQPKPEHKFTFGLCTVGNPGRDPFGEAVRPVMTPVQLDRAEDVNGVKEFARGSMRSYLIYKEKARRFNEDKEIQARLRELSNVAMDGLPKTASFTRVAANALKAASFDRKALGARGLGYERLDQLTLEVILDVR